MSPGTRLVPDPPDPFAPLVETWPAGRRLFRVHSARFPANAFNPGPTPTTRFAFFGDPPIPVLYAGAAEETAVAETLLHDQPRTGGWVAAEQYRGRMCSALTPARDLHLVQLHSGGLLRLGVHARQLTDTSVAHYARTARWASAAHGTGADGLVWMSRQWNGTASMMLFGGRVASADLVVDPEYRRVFLSSPGLNWLVELCATVNVAVMPPA